VQISALRKLLGKGVITTVTGFGYRFTLPDGAPAAKPTEGPPLPDKPSLAVLPFANLSGDPSQDYFIDGVVGDIINGLSRVRAFFVIAQNSSFIYKGRNVSVAEVGRELGVRYVLEGSFQQAGQMLRVSTQLVEAATGRTIWSARFDGARDDVFALQDEITSKIVAVIEPKLVLAEVERVKTLPTENLHAYELCLQALPMVDRPSSLAAMERAIDLAEAGHCRRPGLFLCQGAACLGTCDSICQSMDQFCASARWVEVH
jgi:TolB-like protein